MSEYTAKDGRMPAGAYGEEMLEAEWFARLEKAGGDRWAALRKLKEDRTVAGWEERCWLIEVERTAHRLKYGSDIG